MDVVNEIEMKLYMLPRLEKEIFKSLLRQEGTVSVYEVIKDLIENYFRSLSEKISLLCKLKIIEYEQQRVKICDHTIPIINLFSDTFFPGEIYVPLDEFASVVNKYFPKIETAKNETETIEYKKELLRQFFPFPSYRRIKRILNEFVIANLVISRKDSGGKEKNLYAVNPECLEYCKDIVGRLENG